MVIEISLHGELAYLTLANIEEKTYLLLVVGNNILALRALP